MSVQSIAKPELYPWYRKAGVELTRYSPWEFTDFMADFLKDRGLKRAPTYFEPYSADYEREERARMKPILDERLRLMHRLGSGNSLIWDFGSDSYCTEVSSAPFTRWEELKKFFTVLDTGLDKAGLLRFHEEVCGAGGHIHVAVTQEGAAKIQKLMLNHPWAMMAFAHPSDDQHMLRNLTRKEMNKASSWELRHSAFTTTAASRRGYAISSRGEYGTVEFRMMDVAQTWEMQEEHMAFAQAFVHYAITHPEPTKYLSRRQVSYLKEDKAKQGFKKLIKMLGLPWERYEDYLTNIHLRYKFKTKNVFRV